MPSRTIADHTGRNWIVWSVHPSSTTQLTPAGVHPDYRDGWLAFESVAEKRRLAPIPTEWETASDADLLLMLARAIAARRSSSRR